jgi:hypothetical protein
MIDSHQFAENDDSFTESQKEEIRNINKSLISDIESRSQLYWLTKKPSIWTKDDHDKLLLD